MGPDDKSQSVRQGIYNVDYFSGAQCAVYIGDTWVDEVTSVSFSVRQDRRPLYGYADDLFRDVSKGQVLVQGELTINFKEAGYLFLVLDRYQTLINNRASMMNLNHKAKVSGTKHNTPFGASDLVLRESIESLVNNDEVFNSFERNKIFEAIAAEGVDAIGGELAREVGRTNAAASLGGFSSNTRSSGGIGAAENIFEKFEDAIWALPPEELNNRTRRADHPDLNPFDLFMAYGDFAGDNSANHTINKLEGVHIIGQTRQVVIDGQPIQEAYSFIARNLI